MNNREDLQQMSDEEFAEYIDAVFLAGRLYEAGKLEDTIQLENYTSWLKKEKTTNDEFLYRRIDSK